MLQHTPVVHKEREIFMDVLRGFAILGIFIANLNAFTWYSSESKEITSPLLLPDWDPIMKFIHHVLIEGKFYSIFSFLFGWGISLQIMRIESSGIHAISFIRRRLFIMLLLGAFHLMLWPGDIVFLYAMLGFILLPLRKLSNKTLIITAVCLLLSPIALYALKMKFPVLNYPSDAMFAAGYWADEKLTHVTSEESFKAFIKNANWYQVLLSDLSGFFYRYGDLFFQSRFPKVLGMMCLGLVAGRTEFYKNLTQHKKWIYTIIVIAVVIGLPANYMLAHYMDLKDGAYYKMKMNGLYRTIAYALGVAPLALGYIVAFMLAFQTSIGKKMGGVIAPVGKMAFTNYLMHTLIGNFIFLPAGLGYMGQIGPVYYTLFALIVFLFQILFSTWWLRHFNFGPIEWLWRSGTYKKWQPMKKRNV